MPTTDPFSGIPEEAQRQLAQAVKNGVYILANGRQVSLETEQHVRVLMWAAQQRVKKVQLDMARPEDFGLKKTDGRDAS